MSSTIPSLLRLAKVSLYTTYATSVTHVPRIVHISSSTSRSSSVLGTMAPGISSLYLSSVQGTSDTCAPPSLYKSLRHQLSVTASVPLLMRCWNRGADSMQWRRKVQHWQPDFAEDCRWWREGLKSGFPISRWSHVFPLSRTQIWVQSLHSIVDVVR
jgi:hypothetical protein